MRTYELRAAEDERRELEVVQRMHTATAGRLHAVLGLKAAHQAQVPKVHTLEDALEALSVLVKDAKDHGSVVVRLLEDSELVEAKEEDQKAGFVA